jgi:uncharacterized membrane protein
MPSVGPADVLIVVLITLIWIAIVAGGVMLLGRRAFGRSDRAMDALRERLARGEIDEAEYMRLRAVLQGD